VAFAKRKGDYGKRRGGTDRVARLTEEKGTLKKVRKSGRGKNCSERSFKHQ